MIKSTSGDPMIIVRLSALILIFMSLNVSAEINLNIKIGQVIDSKKVETVKTFLVDYSEDIVIKQRGLKNTIIINLKKFKNVLVNGVNINPIQIDMKMVDSSKKTVGKPQTITTFYNNEALFNIQNSLYSDSGDVSVLLKFREN